MPYDLIKSSKNPPDMATKVMPERNVPHLRNKKVIEDDISDVAVRGPIYSDSESEDEDLLNPKPYPPPMRINYHGAYGLNEPHDPYLEFHDDRNYLHHDNTNDTDNVANEDPEDSQNLEDTNDTLLDDSQNVFR